MYPEEELHWELKIYSTTVWFWNGVVGGNGRLEGARLENNRAIKQLEPFELREYI
jgi:hypothetical protein